MSFSLGEIEAMAKKAARGCGYGWGMADEAGRAVRWLCAQGLDGCGSLHAVLTAFDDGLEPNLMLHPEAGVWQSETGTCCPIALGCTLADRATFLADSPFQASAVFQPILLLPFAAMAARQIAKPVQISWAGGDARTDGDTLQITGDIPARSPVAARPSNAAPAKRTLATRATPDDAVWSALNAFAHRTYAPATEESRQKGAG